MDENYRDLLQQSETLRARRNEVSKQLSRMEDKSAELIADMRKVGDQISSLEAET
ncbi:MAG: serine--tRNA ligase, partial [Candidatus Hodarchaeota archaeon]